jgi:hypothetical protein
MQEAATRQLKLITDGGVLFTCHLSSGFYCYQDLANMRQAQPPCLGHVRERGCVLHLI